jgi:tRNA(Ile)-lysidine synthase TilS/MesJ
MSGDRAPSTRLLARICKEFGIDEGQALRVLAKDHKRDDGRTTLFAAFLRDRTLADPGGE